MLYRQIIDQGYCLLPAAVDASFVQHLVRRCDEAFHSTLAEGSALASQGHVFAARNVIELIPEVGDFWRRGVIAALLREALGEGCGLVRALFFDKPPERTWTLPWHKDCSIAVADNSLPSAHFSRPTYKAGVPHVIASAEILDRMLTLRLHLDPVDDENGPLKVIPGSHRMDDAPGARSAAAVVIHASPGDVLAMRPRIDHCSGASLGGTMRHRRILHLEFASKATLPDGYRWRQFLPLVDDTLANASVGDDLRTPVGRSQ